MDNKFLTIDELGDLTGIRRGKDGKSREQLQQTQLIAMGIGFYVNARGCPVVTWDAVNGKKLSNAKAEKPYVPKALRPAA